MRLPGVPGAESPLSEATRSATLMAAILRGCVQMMLHCPPWPASVAASSKYWGTYIIQQIITTPSF